MEFLLDHPVLTAYLFLRISAINTVLLILMVVSILVTALFAIGWCCESGTENQEGVDLAAKLLKRLIPTSLILVFFFIAAPSQKDLAIMIGANAGAQAIKAVQDSPTAQKAQQALYGYVNTKLDEIIAENTPKKGN